MSKSDVILEGLVMQVAQLETRVDTILGALEQLVDRMEDVLDRVEDERRIDLFGLNDE